MTDDQALQALYEDIVDLEDRNAELQALVSRLQTRAADPGTKPMMTTQADEG